MPLDDPHKTVGNYILYDSDEGAVWAKIQSVSCQSNGEILLITEDMTVRTGDSKSHYNKPRILHWKTLKDTAFLLNEQNITEEIVNRAFAAVLAGEGTTGKETALELGSKESLRHIIENSK